MAQYITTHNADGKAVFSEKIPAPRHAIDIPSGTMEVIYASHTAKPDLSTESDLEQYAHDRTHGLPNNAICPENGVAAAVITFHPDAESPFHRTMTLDNTIVIQGVVELHLDSGEVRTLHVGDSLVQRGTMHKWKNVTPNGGAAKIVGVAQSIVKPLQIAGQKLGQEYVF